MTRSLGRYDAIIIGGGHNGLVSAAYLARAGKRVVVLERRHLVGGAAVTEEIVPGFKFSVFSYVVSLLRPEIIRDLSLPSHGLEILPLESTVTPMFNGDYLAAWPDSDQTRREVARHSLKDAEAYEEYSRLMGLMAMAVKPIISMIPPDPTSLSLRDLRGLLKVGRHFQSLTEKHFHLLYKLMTMSSADFLDEWFETDVLKATKSASGIIGTFMGPRTPGSAYVLLHHYMGEIDGAFRAWGFAKGGTGSISESIAKAAKSFGAEVRLDAEVARVRTTGGKATGVVLANGDELEAPIVVSSLDPKRTFLKLVNESDLPDDFVGDVRRFKIRGSSGKVNLALSGLPDLTCMPGVGPHLRGAISVSPSLEYVERAFDDAKYGSFSKRPYMDIILPSMIDPGMAPPGKHVMSVFVQYAPSTINGGWDDSKRDAFGNAVIDAIAQFAPNIRDIIIDQQVLTPADIERITGLTEGNIFQGELALHQLFFLRPSPGYAQYKTPVKGLWQCGSGTHPGGGIMGAGGRLAALEILGGARVNRYDVIVIGAGANGLAAAALLGKRGKRVLVLERREIAGGTNATEEFHPGFRVNSCRDDVGWVPNDLVRQLQLAKHGLQWLQPTAGLVAVGGDRPAIATYPDIARTIDGLKPHSPIDAGKWAAFTAFVDRVAGFLQAAYLMRAPRVQSRALGDLMALAGLGQRLRRLGKREMMEVLRVVPMPVSDLAEEWFTHESLRAALAVVGTRDVMHGPMSGGTALVLLHQQVGLPAGSIGVRRVPRGGTGALTAALAGAARDVGVEIRLGADVRGVTVEKARATGVRLETGEEIGAPHIVSSADPRRSFSWIDPMWLDPEFLRAVDNIRMRGSTARVHYALDALPKFVSGGVEVSRDALGGTLVLAPSVASVERAYDAAKFGEMPSAPALSVAMPTLIDPSLAPDRKHVLSVTVHHAPYALTGGWNSGAAAELGTHVTQMLSTVFPDVRERMVHQWVLTPSDLATRYGCTEGNLSHGELALDQFLFMRPVPSCARYTTPLAGFSLCGTGSHPGLPGGAAALMASKEVA